MAKFKIFLLVLMIVSAAGFYNPLGIVNAQLSKSIYYLSTVLLIIFGNNSVKLRQISKFPYISYRMVLLGMIGAALMASFFQEQSLSVSIVAILPYFFGYLSLLSLFRSGINEKDILKIIYSLVIISFVIYWINFITFPNMIFGTMDASEVDDSRGMVRLGVLYIELYVFLLYYSIEQWIISRQQKWLAIIAICILMIVLSLARQVIVISAIMGCLYAVKKFVWFKKILFIGIVAFVVLYVVPEIPIYKAMVEVSEQQKEMNKTRDDPRIRCFNFYTDSYQTNEFTKIFGNGVPSIGNSQWGIQFEKITRSEGVYSSDLGWIGFYYHFGLIAAIGVFFLLLKSALYSLRNGNLYISYFLITIMLFCLLSAPILIYRQVINIMLIIYLSYITLNKKRCVQK